MTQSPDNHIINLHKRTTPQTLAIILRHYKENPRKCSLQPLRYDPRFHFLNFALNRTIDATSFALLEIDAPPLTPADASRPLLILDSTWRHLPKMRNALIGDFTPRSLPQIPTANPRTSKITPDPPRGLASIEALYLALRILNQRDDSLLDSYHWKTTFLASCDSLKINP